MEHLSHFVISIRAESPMRSPEIFASDSRFTYSPASTDYFLDWKRKRATEREEDKMWRGGDAEPEHWRLGES